MKIINEGQFEQVSLLLVPLLSHLYSEPVLISCYRGAYILFALHAWYFQENQTKPKFDHYFEYCRIELLDLSIFLKLIHVFLLVVTWISRNWYMDFSNGKSFISISCCIDLSKLLHGFVNVFTLSKLFSVFLALCQTKQSWGLTKISKLVEASVLNKRWLMNQSTECLGSVVPLAWQCFLRHKYPTKRDFGVQWVPHTTSCQLPILMS